jgi:hypothetical protein
VIPDEQEPQDFSYGFTRDGVFIGSQEVFYITGLLSYVQYYQKERPEWVTALEEDIQSVIDRHIFGDALEPYEEDAIRSPEERERQRAIRESRAEWNDRVHDELAGNKEDYITFEEMKNQVYEQDIKEEDARELLEYMIHVVYNPHFRIEGINMDKWTDEKIESCLKWIREKIS